MKINITFKDCLWFLIPLAVIALIYLAIKFVPGEKYDPEFDPRIENCGPGGTSC